MYFFQFSKIHDYDLRYFVLMILVVPSNRIAHHIAKCKRDEGKAGCWCGCVLFTGCCSGAVAAVLWE